MRTIARLFGKSPFSPLQTHMNKVSSCIEKLSTIFSLLDKGDVNSLEEEVKHLSKLEHEADLTKNDIRNHLPKSLFLPIDRAHFLEILTLQDSIADCAEDIGLVLTWDSLELVDGLEKDLLAYVEKNLEAFWLARQIIEEIDELLESSFGGIEAAKVNELVEETALKEHEADRMQRDFIKKIYSLSPPLNAPSFYLWMRLIKEINGLSDLSEKLANRVRMVLELK